MCPNRTNAWQYSSAAAIQWPWTSIVERTHNGEMQTMSIERLQPGPRMSQAVIHNNTVYLAGQIASGAPAGGVREQTRDILTRIDGLLAQAKSDKAEFSALRSGWSIWPALRTRIVSG